VGVVVVLVAATEYTFGYFSRDPAATLGGNPAVGVLTYAGVLVAWGAAAGSALVASLLARARGWREVSALLTGALGLGYLALDDLFQVHEELVPRLLGIPQEVVLVAYAGLAAAFVWWFRHVWARHEWPLLALAMLLLGASVGLDQSGDYVLDEISFYGEESLKLFGFAFLGTYLVRLAVRLHGETYDIPDDPRARSRVVLPVQVPDQA
jgi:hypothetical protein